MKKLYAALFSLVLFAGLAHAAYFQAQTYLPVVSGPVNMGGGPNMIERSLFSSNTPLLPYSQWYVPGNGSPAISTSDYYLMNGIYWGRPYDLDTMGADGAAVKAREGYRYVWMLMADHPFVPSSWSGSSGLYTGYSNDPQIYPDPTTLKTLYSAGAPINVVDQNGTTQNNFSAYQIPFLVYNPDPGAFAPFYIYMEGVSTSSGLAHQLTLFTSSDLLTGTLQGPAIPTTSASGTTSFGQPRRLGVNNWEVYTFGKPGGGPSYTTYKYTSTDGWAWTSTFTPVAAGYGPFLNIAGQDSILSIDRPTPYGTPGGPPEHLAYWPINSNKVITGSATWISDGFQAQNESYPWQTYAQDVQAYEEDGVATIYLTRGYPPSNHDSTNAGPYLGNSPNIYTLVGSVTSNVLTVTSVPASVPPIAVGFKIGPFISIGNPSITAQLTGTGGAACPDPTCNGTTGTYSVALSNQPAGTNFIIATNGGLWHQMVDLYYLTTDATAAASAAPLGVRGSCAGGVAAVQWNNSLPHQNYRVYKGTTSGTQATLVGDVTGTSVTDTPTANAQTWYKVVTMNVTEQKSRVVNVYCSSNTAQVNKHVNRVLNDGGTFNNLTSDITFIATADTWLTSNNTYRYLQWWTDVRFGYKLNGSGFIAKIYDFGTTYLPRGGDYTPTTSNTFPSTSSNTSYSSTSFRGTTPSWINNASSAHGYFGNGRVTIQRWNEITLLAAYQKPGTGGLAMFGLGQFGGMTLTQDSGTSGNVNFSMAAQMTGGSSYLTATVPFSGATTAKVAAGTQSANGDLKAYLDGTPGSATATTYSNPTMANTTVLRGYAPGMVGAYGILTSGSTIGLSGTGSAITMDNSALATFGGLGVFNKDLGQALIQSWGALYN